VSVKGQDGGWLVSVKSSEGKAEEMGERLLPPPKRRRLHYTFD
jgi:hypothetical protein